MTTNDAQCVSCRFWCELRADDVAESGSYSVNGGGTGLCRRYPPSGARKNAGAIADSADAAFAAAWTITWSHDWCGEFVPCPKQE
jgi:hypothetical protein